MEELKYHYKYPHPSVTTDCVIFGFDGTRLNVLLVERGIEPYKGRWAFPGGFLRMDETTEAGALRELKEETEFDVERGFLEQLGCFSDVDRDPRGRVITIAYYALVQKGAVKGGDDARNAQWFPIGEIPQLAFDHEKILLQALKRLKTAHLRPF
jgi:8-oxo-dGTP diphosphatase